MGFDAYLTLAVVAMVVALLAATRLAPDLVLGGGLMILLLTGIVGAEDALAGFSNEGMITIGLLFVVAAGVVETGAISWLADRLFGRSKSVVRATWRMMAPTAVLSAFINNTPVVAMLIPTVNEWAKKHRIPSSKLMIPLSYAAILGGICTLVGTSTNLLVNGMLIRVYETQQAAGIAPNVPRGLGMFDIAWVGVPCSLAGVALVIAGSHWLLPNRQAAMASVADPRQYTIEMLVEPGCPLVGKSIEQAGLRHLRGLYLAEIYRDEMVLPAVGPEEVLRGNDRLVFVGIVDSMVDLQKIRGLTPATNQVFKLDSPRSTRCLIEAVPSTSCPVVGKTIREGRFRSLYNAVVIAVARHGERVRGKIGDIVLRAGDSLLLEAHPSFVNEHRNSRKFYLISKVENSNPPRHERWAIALAILLGMVLAITLSGYWGTLKINLGGGAIDLGKITMLKGAMVAAALMVLTRCVHVNEARRSIDWQVLLAIACALGIGRALENSGAADQITGAIIQTVQGNPWLALAAIYLMTLLVTEIITNSASAALMFPFALSTAQHLDANVYPFVICVMIAASAGFATPISYQTNLMVYGPGSYRFSDYLRVGIPLDITVGAVAVTLIPLAWPFYP
ncbi:MAG: SLC13 family permease [Planctomycetes bacterium]|nr:SLC13 family permease [Planctomycetota bacterium]MBU4399423.1 SLC13 family permease [Planctomycetota bacterium]MCG2682788.1 SLC13 family permease [Planctomycetales bacterium]